jgi:excisionase family DNA binding protein
MTTIIAPLIVSVAQAATMLSLSREYVYRLINAGELRTVQMGTVGSHLRIRVTDIEKLIESRSSCGMVAQ